jgi:hypothetical protein
MKERQVSKYMIVEMLASLDTYCTRTCSYKTHFVEPRTNPTLSLIPTIMHGTKVSRKDSGSMTELQKLK